MTVEVQINDYATRASLLRRTVMEWQNWIEEKLGICLPEAAILETRLNLAQIGVERILGLPGDQGDDSRTINCLDGVATGEEIVVIATANEPTALGPAILRRPGRFDRIVNFSNPSGALREVYADTATTIRRQQECRKRQGQEPEEGK